MQQRLQNVYHQTILVNLCLDGDFNILQKFNISNANSNIFIYLVLVPNFTST